MMKKLTLAAFAAATLLLSSLNSMAQTGGALNFDGSNDYVSLGNPSSMQFASTDEFSVELWVNPSNTSGGWHSIIDKTLWGYSSTGTGLLLYIYNDVLYLVTPTWSTNNGILFSTSIQANTWTHIAFTYNSGTWNMYKNDTSLGSAVTGSYTNSSSPWTIGMRTNNDASGMTDPTAMSIDELRIWNRALVAAEIAGSMNCEMGTDASLVAYYKLNQGTTGASNTSVNTVTDNSGNGNTGTLNNFALTGTSSNWVAGKVSGSCYTATGSKVSICHKGKTISIDTNALKAHLGHGDDVDACSTTKGKGKSGKRTSSPGGSENSIAEISGDEIKIYPNPAESAFNIFIPVTYKQAEIQISDMTGRIMENRTITENDGTPVQFNLSNVPNGIYLVKVSSENGNYIGKLIRK